MNFILIHVDKCSGTYLTINLKRNIKYKYIHHANVSPKTISPNPNSFNSNKFICIIRHPIDRWISAFNFKYTRVVLKNVIYQRVNKKQGFMKYKTASNLAESLYNKDGMPNIEAQSFALSGCDHLEFGLDHYLCNFEKKHNVKVNDMNLLTMFFVIF